MQAVLKMNQRQIREAEIYSTIAPIAWDVSVSRPPEKDSDDSETQPTDEDAAREVAIAAKLKAFCGVKD